jgi:glycosyltransferase involved in cell wall biosynthesis
MAESLVSIGVPTYRRPELLRLALESIANQTYRDIEVLVSDNATPGSEVEAVIDEYRLRIPNLKFVRQTKNIGSIPNFMYLLQQARTPYFMWLADDDSLSPRYIEALIKQLEADRDAVCACGYTLRVGDIYAPTMYRTSHFAQRSVLLRLLHFLWLTDDYFYYGLHRTDVIRRAEFTGFWRPNARVISNWCYVYLCDVVLAGKVVFCDDRTVYYQVKVDTRKYYEGPGKALLQFPKTLIRRINVHYLYWRKIIAKLSPIALIAALPVSVASLLREYSFDLVVRAVHKLNRSVRRSLGLPVPAP